jgi:hypothetical protein
LGPDPTGHFLTECTSICQLPNLAMALAGFTEQTLLGMSPRLHYVAREHFLHFSFF